jgi:hypothetical protein
MHPPGACSACIRCNNCRGAATNSILKVPHWIVELHVPASSDEHDEEHNILVSPLSSRQTILLSRERQAAMPYDTELLGAYASLTLQAVLPIVLGSFKSLKVSSLHTPNPTPQPPQPLRTMLSSLLAT